ncbi:hypothetical protein JIN85_13755 [Luteolibacter pohnpeiensis]|uniref:Uncharacterized protein n=1 Tax=Luteolibacter pohnpeiensis TaxID=454153 RepID=A0A934S777_9BACT|nr:hypothetical protein [Luteolibacter pohnpeiensis]MBK1883487.1 hypothetical protein [Luteolibacter pohnpeiensis]
MTRTRYFFAKIAQNFGIHRRNIRMTDAASEMHLLREAEAHLGEIIWDRVENIEALSVEYWNLRKLIKEREALVEELKQRESHLSLAHEERSTLLSSTANPQEALIQQRQAIVSQMEKLTIRRDEIVQQARDVRRTYDGLNLKLEVLTRDNGAAEEIHSVKTRLAALKANFAALKTERVRVANEIDAGEAKIDALNEEYQETSKGIRSQASQASQQIGETNRGISSLRSELASIDTQMNHLYTEIGRYVSRNVEADPACAQAAKPKNGLIQVMKALRHSILLNHQLSGMN